MILELFETWPRPVDIPAMSAISRTTGSQYFRKLRTAGC